MFRGLFGLVSGRKASGRPEAGWRWPARPFLEELEQRELPTGTPVTVVITGLSQSYNLTSQSETISAQVTSLGSPVVNSPVTFTDAGRILTANTDANGNAKVTFTFNLFQEQPKAHTITASFPGNAAVASGSASVNAPDTTLSYYFQLFQDYTIIALLAPGLVPTLNGYVAQY